MSRATEDIIAAYINRIVSEYGPVQLRVDSDGRFCAAIDGHDLPLAEGALLHCVGYGPSVQDAMNDAAVDLDD